MVDKTFKADVKVLNLARAMQTAFTSVTNHAMIDEKAKSLKDPINRLLKQIIECGYFIREYISQKFIGMLHYFRNVL